VGYSSEAVQIRLALFATELGVIISNSEAEQVQWQVEAIELKCCFSFLIPSEAAEPITIKVIIRIN